MKKNFLMKNIIIISLIIGMLALMGCSSKNDSKNNISIAEQFGLAYAPLQIMKENKILEKNYPGVKIDWKSADILAPIYKLSKEEVLKYITDKDMIYTQEVKGINEFVKFMKKNNYITKEYSDKNSTMWEDVKHEK